LWRDDYKGQVGSAFDDFGYAVLLYFLQVITALAHAMEKKDQRPALVFLSEIVRQKQQVITAYSRGYRLFERLRMLARRQC
jgi:hypothetical protein